jgi:hypothetical protein
MTEDQVRAHQQRINMRATGHVKHSSDGKNVVNLSTLPKPSKYRNRKCVVDGEKFDSEKEARRWRELKLLEHAGEIKNLRRQVRYELRVGRIPICAYVADFAYVQNSRRVVEDVKGYRRGNPYRLFLVKKALMKSLHNISIVEV